MIKNSLKEINVTITTSEYDSHSYPHQDEQLRLFKRLQFTLIFCIIPYQNASIF